MEFQVRDLSKDHSVVKASHAMAVAYSENETMIPALYKVSGEFPEIDSQVLIGLWLGVNAREILNMRGKA